MQNPSWKELWQGYSASRDISCRCTQMVPLTGPRTKIVTTVRNISFLQSHYDHMYGPMYLRLKVWPGCFLNCLAASKLVSCLLSFLLWFPIVKRQLGGDILNEKVGGLKEFQIVNGLEYPSIPGFIVNMVISICRNKTDLPAQDGVLILEPNSKHVIIILGTSFLADQNYFLR